jgi:hypothetical protein
MYLRFCAYCFSVSVSCAFVGCATSSAADEQSAVVVQVSANSRADLLGAIKSALGDREVTLAQDALTQESDLTVEPVRPRDVDGRLLQGRETRAPEKFLLVKKGGHCILIHERTGERIDLAHTQCIPKS